MTRFITRLVVIAVCAMAGLVLSQPLAADATDPVGPTPPYMSIHDRCFFAVEGTTVTVIGRKGFTVNLSSRRLTTRYDLPGPAISGTDPALTLTTSRRDLGPRFYDQFVRVLVGVVPCQRVR